MPNPWDVGSAKFLAVTGVEALATTSAGFAWSLGRDDQQVSRDELVRHTADLSEATALPLNVDSENCFPGEPGGVAETVRRLTRAGAAGCSIEDFDPATGKIMDIVAATAAVREAAEAANEEDVPIVVTARAENYLYGRSDLDDTIARLVGVSRRRCGGAVRAARHRPRRDHEARRRSRERPSTSSLCLELLAHAARRGRRAPRVDGRRAGEGRLRNCARRRSPPARGGNRLLRRRILLGADLEAALRRRG